MPRAKVRLRRSGFLGLFGPGWDAVRASARPFLLIQCAAALVVAFYYLSPEFRAGADSLQRFKVEGGLAFAALSTAFAGAVLPEIAKRLTMRKRAPTGELLFQVSFFACLGITVDLLYWGLALWLGSKASVGLVAEKVLIDQLVYSPCVSIPVSVLAFGWKDSGFSFAKTQKLLSAGGFARRYFPLLATCWCFWFPVLTAVYSMPTNLQFLLFLCTEAAWSLLLVHVATTRHETGVGL